MAYPTSVISFTTHNAGDIVQPADINNPDTEIVSIEQGLLNGFQHILKPFTDNTYDLGTSALTWRNLLMKGGINPSGSVSFTLGQSAPATTSTAGFPYLPSMAGLPTGTPTAITGFAPFVWDDTNKIFRVYSPASSGWQAVAASSGPTTQVFTSGSGTYTTPANIRKILVEVVGGGGGGGGGGSGTPGTGTAGGTSTFGTSLLSATGGGTGGNLGGVGSGGDVNLAGGTGGVTYIGADASGRVGGAGGVTIFGGGGTGVNNGAGNPAAANTGAGGGAGGGTVAPAGGAGVGGSAGGYCRKILASPAATYTYAIGAGGAGGAAGTNGLAGAAGAAGIIIVTEFYS